MSVRTLKDVKADVVDVRGRLVVVDFYADWCDPCQTFGPIFEKAALAHTEVDFLKVNADKELGMMAVYGVKTLPTLLFFRDGREIFRHQGGASGEQLEAFLSHHSHGVATSDTRC